MIHCESGSLLSLPVADNFIYSLLPWLQLATEQEQLEQLIDLQDRVEDEDDEATQVGVVTGWDTNKTKQRELSMI